MVRSLGVAPRVQPRSAPRSAAPRGVDPGSAGGKNLPNVPTSGSAAVIAYAGAQIGRDYSVRDRRSEHFRLLGVDDDGVASGRGVDERSPAVDDRAGDRDRRGRRPTNQQVLQPGRHQLDRAGMFEEVPDRDEGGEREHHVRGNVPAMLLLEILPRNRFGLLALCLARHWFFGRSPPFQLLLFPAQLPLS